MDKINFESNDFLSFKSKQIKEVPNQEKKNGDLNRVRLNISIKINRLILI